MKIVTRNGKILLKNGKIATANTALEACGCCCNAGSCGELTFTVDVLVEGSLYFALYMPYASNFIYRPIEEQLDMHVDINNPSGTWPMKLQYTGSEIRPADGYNIRPITNISGYCYFPSTGEEGCGVSATHTPTSDQVFNDKANATANGGSGNGSDCTFLFYYTVLSPLADLLPHQIMLTITSAGLGLPMRIALPTVNDLPGRNPLGNTLGVRGVESKLLIDLGGLCY